MLLQLKSIGIAPWFIMSLMNKYMQRIIFMMEKEIFHFIIRLIFIVVLKT